MAYVKKIVINSLTTKKEQKNGDWPPPNEREVTSVDRMSQSSVSLNTSNLRCPYTFKVESLLKTGGEKTFQTTNLFSEIENSILLVLNTAEIVTFH